MNINGDTKIIYFFGSTYKTSKMYSMYNAAFEKLNLNFVYVPAIVKDLQKAVEGIRQLEIKAIGVTVPYKVEIVSYIDILKGDAKKIKAVNVVINENGKLIGYNTDGDGCTKALKEVIELENKTVLLLGAGGAARAIAFSLKQNKAKIIISNRTKKLAQDLAKEIKGDFVALESINSKVKEADIIINATTVGMYPDINACLIPKKALKKEQIVMDIISKPRETRLLQYAKEVGCTIVYGERMLLWQGVTKFKLYTGINAPIKTMEEIFI